MENRQATFDGRQITNSGHVNTEENNNPGNNRNACQGGRENRSDFRHDPDNTYGQRHQPQHGRQRKAGHPDFCVSGAGDLKLCQLR